MDAIDTLVKAYLPKILEFFTHYSYGAIAFMVLLLLAVFSVSLIFMRGTRVKKELVTAATLLEKVKDEAEFTEKYLSISSELKKLPALKRNWEEFEETLIPPLDDIDDPEYRVFRNTKRPQAFFTGSAVTQTVKPFMDSERLIGIGLLLTFLGLVAALSEASAAFTSGDNSVIKDGLAGLLSTAGAKFLASIGGLGGAIFQSLFEGVIVRDCYRKLATFNDLLEERLSFASLEKISADQYGHSKRQTARLEEMSTEITMALGTQISDALASIPAEMGVQLGQAFEPLSQKIEQITENLSNKGEESAAQMVQMFTDQIKGASDQSMNQVVSQLDSLSGTLTSVISGMAQSNEELRVSLGEAVSAINNSANAFETSVSSSAETAGTQLVEIVERITSQQDQNMAVMTTVIDRFSMASDKMAAELESSSTASMNKVAEGIQQALSGVLHTAETSSRQISENLQETLSNTGNEVVTHVTTVLEKSTADIESAMSSISSRIEGWGAAVATLSTTMQATNTKLGDYRASLEAAGQSFNTSTTSIKGAAESIRGAAEPLALTSNALKTASESIVSASRNLQTTAENFTTDVIQSIEGIEQAATTLQDMWSKHSEHFGSVDKELENAFGAITRNLQTALGSLEKYNTGFSAKVGEALQDLSSIVSELSDSVEELNPAKRR